MKAIYPMCLGFLLPLFSVSQEITYPDIEKYLEKPKQAIGNSIEAFQAFEDALYEVIDPQELDEPLTGFQEQAKALQVVLNSTKALDNEKWFLPEAKKTADYMLKISTNVLVDIVEEVKETGFFDVYEPNDKYLEARGRLDSLLHELNWTERILVAQMLYKQDASGFCVGSMILADEAQNNFPRLNTGPMADRENVFNVSDIPSEAISGEIIINAADDTIARFIMYQSDSLEVAYQAFTNMVYYLLACDHGNMEIFDEITPLEEINEWDYNFPVFEYRPKDFTAKYTILISILGPIETYKEDWEVYIDYVHLNQ